MLTSLGLSEAVAVATVVSSVIAVIVVTVVTGVAAVIVCIVRRPVGTSRLACALALNIDTSLSNSLQTHLGTLNSCIYT